MPVAKGHPTRHQREGWRIVYVFSQITHDFIVYHGAHEPLGYLHG